MLPDEPELVEEAAGGDELDDFEEDEPPPQPATARAATVSANPNHRRVVSQLMFISVPLFTNKEGRRTVFLPAQRLELRA